MNIETLLPPGGIGFTNYNHTPGDRFGTAATISALGTIGLLWSLISRTPFAVGDISHRGGGKMPGHASHKHGIDVDIRPLRHDGQNAPVLINDPAYSREATRSLVRVMRAGASIGLILFNDLALRSAGLTTYFAGHNNHLHVRFKPTQAPLSLKQGTQNAAVAGVQTRLIELGHGEVVADEEFGPRTRAAVITFQKSRGLTRDGVVGISTLKELALAVSQAS